MSFLRKAFVILLSLISILALERGCHHITKGFSLAHVFLKETPPLSPQELKLLEKQADALPNRALNQSYSFLAKGGECYVFQSQDGNYILKLFKCHHFTSLNWADSIPLFGESLKQKKHHFLEKRRFLAHRFWKSCLLFYNLPKKEALLYLQITPCMKEKKVIVLYDKIGIKHELPLHLVPFALQKKVDLFLPLFRKDLKEKNWEKARNKIEKAIGAYGDLILSGVYNCDPEMKRNLGWLEDKAIFFDLGSLEDLKLNPAILADIRGYLRKSTLRLQKVLTQEAPSLLPYYEEQIEKKALNLKKDH